ncbi:hypothetical protein P376_1668 [Streptomyces sp. HCCB10043]|nr:hypothetical protein P376_1668 [Streptomyces sp. HCCB10043]
MVGVEGQVCRTGLEHREQGDDQLVGSGDGECHDPLGAGPQPAQDVRQCVRTGVEGLVRDGLAPVDDRVAAGRAGRLCLEQLRQGRVGKGVRRVVPLGEEAPLLLGGEDVKGADRRVGPRTGEAGHQPQDGFLVDGQVLGGVQLGVGIEVHAPGGVRGPAVDDEGQVLDGTVGEVVHARRGTGEVQLVVEDLEVHVRSGQRLAGVAQPQVAADVLETVALVGQAAPHRFPDAPEQPREALVRGDRQPQRHHVGHHAGSGAHGLGPSRHRQAEDDVPLPGQAGDVQQLDRDEQGGQRHAAARCHAAEGIDQLRLQRGRHPDPAGRPAPSGVAERGGRPMTRQGLRPVGPVGGEGRGLAVVAVVGEQVLDSAVGALRHGVARDQGAVDIGGAPHEDGAAVAVEHRVVAPQVPVVGLLGDLEQGERQDPALLQGQRPVQLVGHPPPRRLFRPGPVGEVQDRYGARPVGGEELHGTVLRLHEPHAHGVGLVEGAACGTDEEAGVQGAPDLDVLGDAVVEAVGGETLREPHPGLGGRQGELPVRRSGHDRSLAVAADGPVP